MIEEECAYLHVGQHASLQCTVQYGGKKKQVIQQAENFLCFKKTLKQI